MSGSIKSQSLHVMRRCFLKSDDYSIFDLHKKVLMCMITNGMGNIIGMINSVNQCTQAHVIKGCEPPKND